MDGPLFSFYGAKWRSVPLYPAPRFGKIVELFAGSAGYASRYPDLEVTLVEKDPIIAALWRWLIVTPSDAIAALPDIDGATRFDDLDIPQEAKWLMGFWLNQGGATPKKGPSVRYRNPIAQRFDATVLWRRRRERVARGVKEIRHWRVIEGSWDDVPTVDDATYFIDPPYAGAGKYYRHKDVDYVRLGELCRALDRDGNQVIACENQGATWLPFRPLARVKASSYCGARCSAEAIWP